MAEPFNDEEELREGEQGPGMNMPVPQPEVPTPSMSAPTPGATVGEAGQQAMVKSTGPVQLPQELEQAEETPDVSRSAPRNDYINPRRALWAGTVLDIATAIATRGQGQMGRGVQMYTSALHYNHKQTKPNYQFLGGQDVGFWRVDKNDPNSQPELVIKPSALSQGTKVGQINPRDVVFGSLQKFIDHKQATGVEDFSILERYNPFEIVKNPDGTSMLVNTDTGDSQILRGVDDVVSVQNRIAGEKDRTLFLNAYGADAAGTLDAIKTVQQLRDELAALGTGPLVGEVRARMEAKYQVARAKLNTYALKNIAALADMGVKLNPITVEELKILFDTSPQLSNLAEANVEILDNKLSELNRLWGDLTERKNFYDLGGMPMNYVPTRVQEALQEDKPPRSSTGDGDTGGSSTVFRSSVLEAAGQDAEVTLDEVVELARKEGKTIDAILQELGIDLMNEGGP